MKYGDGRRAAGAGLPSLPVRGAWVEIHAVIEERIDRPRSLPVRGAWVEMRICPYYTVKKAVAPRAGSVG